MIISAVIDERLQFSHSTLSELRRIEGRLSLLPPILHSSIQTIHMLQTLNSAFQNGGTISDESHETTQEILQNYTSMANDYIRNAVFLLDKIRGTAQLLSDTLNLKHQQTSQNISENTLALTNSAVRDSATIRVITVVTLLYLPATFVAVSSLVQHFHDRI